MGRIYQHSSKSFIKAPFGNTPAPDSVELNQQKKRWFIFEEQLFCRSSFPASSGAERREWSVSDRGLTLSLFFFLQEDAPPSSEDKRRVGLIFLSAEKNLGH